MSALAEAFRPVVGIETAMEIVGTRSRSAFYRWTKLQRVSPCGWGRYSRDAILAGLARECRRKPHHPSLVTGPVANPRAVEQRDA